MNDRPHSIPALAEQLHRESVKARLFGRSPGVRFDRYVVLGKLGEGGTGTVFAAHDPSLERKVAIKLLSAPEPAGQDGTPGWVETLEQEARAMARLSHPNVVHVYEVGERDGQRYLVMELVEGTTLRRWQQQVREQAGPRRAVVEITAMYVQAGRGLAAAHRAGLVHRDFKPDNVLVDEDERAKVCDFGLARGFEADLVPSTLPEALRHGALDREAEGSGSPRTAIVGTPAYMAPEQLRGQGATERSDQFAFCVALHEALEGERPFEGDVPLAIANNVLDGRRRATPKGSAVPGWLRRVLDRGLSIDPAARWPSMEALLEALARGRLRARLRGAGFGVVGLAALGTVTVLVDRHQRALREAECEALGDEIEIAWSDERRQALREALERTGVSHASATADRLMPWLDRQAAAWRSAQVDACLDARVRGTADEARLERARWCLDERRLELQALVDELMHADRPLLSLAVNAASGLSSVAPCRDPRALASMSPPSEDVREAVQAVRADLARAGALELAGHYQAGLELAQQVLVRAQDLQWPPLVAAAQLRVGILRGRMGDIAGAGSDLEDTFFGAARGVAPEVQAMAAISLVFVAYEDKRLDDALRWGRHAELALAAITDEERIHYARLIGHTAIVNEARGDHARAIAQLEQALEIEQRVLGEEHPYVAITMDRLASVHRLAGDYDAARVLHERALASQERALGPDHPNLGTTLTNLGNVERLANRLDVAQACYERALALESKGLGPDHPDVLRTRGALASLHASAGRYQQALVLAEQVLASMERTLGPDAPDVAKALHNLGNLRQILGHPELALPLHERAADIVRRTAGPQSRELAGELVSLANAQASLGRREQAIELYEQALTIQEQLLGPEHPDLTTALVNVAEEYLLAGELDRAAAQYERALAIEEATLGRDNPEVAYSIEGLAEVELARGRPQEAIALAQRAVEVRSTPNVPPDRLASARFLLARALALAPDEQGGDRARALALAQQAREALVRAGEGSAEEVASIDAWRRELSPEGPEPR